MLTRFIKITRLFALATSALYFTACAPTAAMDDWENFVPHSGQSLFSQLSRQEVLQINLVANLDSLVNVRNSDEYSAGSFSYKEADGRLKSYTIKVKPRGKFRRKICDFPPLKLKFSKEELEAAGFEPLNEMKLVSHCLDDEQKSKDLLLREYLVYKLYNELTPNSYRVQLAQITYTDSNDPSNKITRWGFLMEDKEELESRMNGKVIEKMGQPAELFNTTQERIASMFQYMVGNTDWSYTMLRNVSLVETETGKLIPVPYDFDFSNIVGAPYARPNVDVKQTGRMERVFMGHSQSAKELYSTLAYFKTKKQDLLNVVYNFRELDEDWRIGVANYLESFFTEIQSLDAAEKSIFGRKNAISASAD
jgi:hypothetical protein